MQKFNFPTENNKIILALGAESAGNFSIHIPSALLKGGVGGGLGESIYFSEDFGDLLEEKNWLAFRKAILNFLKKSQLKPNIIITDLHPLMKTTLWGQELSKKYKAKFIQVQHHHAHLFSQIKPLPLGKGEVGRGLSQITSYELPVTSYGITIDGTGYGTDEHIWGGEVFQLRTVNCELRTERIGSLENQILLGGELAIKEPARVLLSILNKFLDKKAIYPYMATFYSRNEFELLYNQLEQNFNCIETSSTGRILDAVSLLLGFCSNKRKYKHEPIDLLETNSTTPYTNLKPKIIQLSATNYELQTTTLFKYLIKNLHKDKKRLAATAQLYIAQGLHEIIKKDTKYKIQNTFFSGGLSENSIIKNYFISQKLLENKNTCVPKGDAGLSFGQIIYYLLNTQI